MLFRSERWQAKHWQAIVSAYRTSPYFIYFENELKQFYSNRFDLLLEFNTALLKILFEILKIKKEINYTQSYYESSEGFLDLRNSIHPKINSDFRMKQYPQVFDLKFGFTPNLSILDLIFNVGLNSMEHLK